MFHGGSTTTSTIGEDTVLLPQNTIQRQIWERVYTRLCNAEQLE
jgi:hypothetical protein